MPVYKLNRLVHPGTLRGINPRSLLRVLQPHRTFFDRHGPPLPAVRDAAKLDLDGLARVLAQPDLHPPKGLADALYYINELATPEGMDALRRALPDEDLGGGGMFEPLEPADVALHAWLKAPGLVERKHAELSAARPRRFEYFQSAQDPPPPMGELTPDRLAALQAYLDAPFAARRRGRGVRVHAYPGAGGSGGGDWLFAVRHGDPKRREGALEGTEETSVLYRPLKFDVVGYGGETGTLRVHAGTTWQTSLYRNAFGLHLFGALDHFPDGRLDRYTLEPLRAGDRACLACADAPPIKLVTVTELHLRWGGIYGEAQTHRARDVFGALRQRRAEVPQGPRIEQASFDVFVFGRKQPLRVTVVPPNVARYTDERGAALIDTWLALRGFLRRPGAAAQQHDPLQTGTLLPLP